jgi:hypothetical protein
MKQKSSKKRKIFPDKDRRQSKKKSPPVDESVLIPETGHEDVQGDVPFATEAAGCKQNDVRQPENSTKIIEKQPKCKRPDTLQCQEQSDHPKGIEKEDEFQEKTYPFFSDNAIEEVKNVPSLVSVPVFSELHAHVHMSKKMEKMLFHVFDNEGLGNCFYESILASSVFQKKHPHYKGDYSKLRADLQSIALGNPEIATAVFHFFENPNDVLAGAEEFLNENIKNAGLEDGKFLFENLSRDEKFRAHFGIAHECPHSVQSKLFALSKDDEMLSLSLLMDWVSEKDKKEMACKWWLQGLTTDLEWAGSPEMMLVAIFYKLQIIVLLNTETGPKLQSSHAYLHLFDSKIFPKKPPCSLMKNTIFLWAIDRDAPRCALKENESPKHYVCLELEEKEKKYLGREIMCFKNSISEK